MRLAAPWRAFQLRLRQTALHLDASLPLSLKLLLPLLALGIVGATFVGILIYRTQADYIRSEFETRALLSIETIRAMVGEHGEERSRAELLADVQVHVDALAGVDEAVLRARVYTADAEAPLLVASAERGDNGAEASLEEIREDIRALGDTGSTVQEEKLGDRNALEIIAPLDVAGVSDLVASVYFSTEERDDALAALLRTFVLSAAFVLLLVPLLLLSVLRVLVFRRLRAILATARRMTDGDYTARVEGVLPRTARDELMQLSLRFNEMAAAIQAMHSQLQDLAATDELTGLYSRRHVLDALDREIERAKRGGHPLAVIMLDVDRLKDVNDRWGHATGDEALRQTAAALRLATRAGDVPARFGGDEFLVLLPDGGGDALRHVLQRIQGHVEQLSVGGEDEAALFSLTVSGGGALLEEGDTTATLIHRADVALLEAKQAGRNQVRVAA